MKLYVSIDMEGMPGTFNWEQEKINRAAVKQAMMDHVTDLIEAVKSSAQNDEITEILIADSHSAGDNLDYSVTAMDDRVNLISGGPRPFYMMPMLDSSFSQVMLLGYHAGTGALKGNMDHSYSNSRIQKIWINGIRMSEALINAAYAGSLGIPVSLVSGDLALQNELLDPDAMPWLHFVCTKEAHSKFSAKLYPRHKVQREFITAVHSALKHPIYPLYKLESPYELKIEFHSTAMTDQACLMPYVKRLDGRTVSYTDNDYSVIFEAVMALVTLASTAGI